MQDLVLNKGIEIKSTDRQPLFEQSSVVHWVMQKHNELKLLRSAYTIHLYYIPNYILGMVLLQGLTK